MTSTTRAPALLGDPGRQMMAGTIRRIRVPAMWRLETLHNALGPAGDDDRSTALDSGSPRRRTVMCALHCFGSVIHEYQSDSSSKQPVSSAFQDIPGGPEPNKRDRHVDSRSLHISRPMKNPRKLGFSTDLRTQVAVRLGRCLPRRPSVRGVRSSLCSLRARLAVADAAGLSLAVCCSTRASLRISATC